VSIGVGEMDGEEGEARTLLLGDGTAGDTHRKVLAGRVRSLASRCDSPDSAWRPKHELSVLSLASDLSTMRTAESLEAVGGAAGVFATTATMTGPWARACT